MPALIRSVLATCMLSATILAVAGCSSYSKSAGSGSSVAVGDAVNTIDPVSGERVTTGAYNTQWDGMTIGFASQFDANQFDSLPAEGKHKAVARMVRDELGSINDHCPVSGDWLMPGAQAVPCGEYTVAVNAMDVKQWESLPENQHAKLIAGDVLRKRGVVNDRCPISGKRLSADAPAVEFEGRMIGFASEIDRNQWQSLPERSQTRLFAGVSGH